MGYSAAFKKYEKLEKKSSNQSTYTSDYFTYDPFSYAPFSFALRVGNACTLVSVRVKNILEAEGNYYYNRV